MGLKASLFLTQRIAEGVADRADPQEVAAKTKLASLAHLPIPRLGRLTWLHVSDLHIRSGDPYDRDVVMRALVESVADYAKRGRRPDLIFATGDIAFSGHAKEYLVATKFFDDLLRAAGLDKRRLFIIPGITMSIGMPARGLLEHSRRARRPTSISVRRSRSRI